MCVYTRMTYNPTVNKKLADFPVSKKQQKLERIAGKWDPNAHFNGSGDNNDVQ